MTDAGAAPPGGGRWGDLRTRVISAVVMLAVGAAEIWMGGRAFAALVVILTAMMIWELARLTALGTRNSPVMLAALAAATLTAVVAFPAPQAASLLLVPALALALTPRRDRRIAAAYGAAVMLAGFGLIDLRGAGTPVILWLIGVVVLSDVLGYFVGRLVGGPKFWPRVSPKKTWSGTVAGWIGAAALGAAFAVATGAGWGLVVLSPVVCLAGQLGDIAESWIKRRAGVKDSSRLIPGHGGVMDRFDALTGAVVAVMLLSLVIPLPLPRVGG